MHGGSTRPSVAPVVDWHVPTAEEYLPAESTFAAWIVPGVLIASFCVCWLAASCASASAPTSAPTNEEETRCVANLAMQCSCAAVQLVFSVDAGAPFDRMERN